MSSVDSKNTRPEGRVRIRRPADGLFLVSWVVLCVVLPSVFTGDALSGISSFALAGQWVVLAYSGTHVALLLRRGEPLWFDTMFWMFAYVWIALAGWAQLTQRDNPYHVGVSITVYEKVVVLALLGMMAYDVGKLCLRGRSWPETNPVGRTVNIRRTLVVAFAALVITPVLVQILGGIGTLFSPRSDRAMSLEQGGLLTEQSKVSGGLLLAFTNSLPLIALLAVIAILHHRRDLLRRPFWLCLIALLGFMTLAVGNPISNPRFWTGTIILSITFSMPWANSGRGYRATIILVLTALIVIFPYADRYRYAHTETQTQSLGYMFVNKSDYDAAVQMATAVEFVDATGGTHGRQIVGVLGFFIPRSTWPEKPGATGSLLTAYIGYPQSNVSSPLWVEAYVDGGLFAVALTFGGLGIFATYIQRLRGRRAGEPVSWAMLLTPVVAGYGVVLLRGSLLSGVGALVVLIGLSWLVTAKGEVRGRGDFNVVRKGANLQQDPLVTEVERDVGNPTDRRSRRSTPRSENERDPVVADAYPRVDAAEADSAAGKEA